MLPKATQNVLNRPRLGHLTQEFRKSGMRYQVSFSRDARQTLIMRASCFQAVGVVLTPLFALSIHQVLQGRDEGVEALRTHHLSVPVLDISDSAESFRQNALTLACRGDQLCSAVARIGPSLQVACMLQLVHQLGHRRSSHVRPSRQLGQPSTRPVDGAKHLQVRLADITVGRLATTPIEIFPEDPKHAHQQLSDWQLASCAHPAQYSKVA